MEARDKSIPLDAEVFAVIYNDEMIGDVIMSEVAKSEAEARKHWRFKANWISKDDRSRTRIEQMTHREFIQRAYMKRSANPFETLENMKFISEIGFHGPNPPGDA